MKPNKSDLTSVPDEFPVTPEMKAYALKIGYVADLESLTEDFLIHHGAEGTLFKNWNLAWKKWLRNQKQWYPEKNVSKNRQPPAWKPPEIVKNPISVEQMRASRKKVRAILPGLTKKV